MNRRGFFGTTVGALMAAVVPSWRSAWTCLYGRGVWTTSGATFVEYKTIGPMIPMKGWLYLCPTRGPLVLGKDDITA